MPAHHTDLGNLSHPGDLSVQILLHVNAEAIAPRPRFAASECSSPVRSRHAIDQWIADVLGSSVSTCEPQSTERPK